MKYSNLTFEEVNHKVFRGIELAFFAGKTGKSMPIVFNAANEIAVELFLNNKIKFLDIYKIIENEMNNHNIINVNNLETILEIDREVRAKLRREYL
jgi:1-deoxy-D-xylulose-5-phosphate reductoisomerase